MGWVELAQKWNKRETRTGAAAVRAFRNRTSTSGTLPAMNEQHPSTSLQSLYVTSRDFTKIDQSSTELCVLQYAPFTDENPDPSASFAALPRRWRIGGEFINIEAGTPFYWESDGALVNQNTFKRIVNETYIITQVVADMDPSNPAGKHATIIAAAGKLNNASWEGFAPGHWLYIGADIDEQFSSSGLPSYRIEHNFSARIVGTSDGWQRVYNEEFAVWDRISTTQLFDRTKQLYEYVDFDTIVS
jgi:hypothetical protein